jgi:hypothetical protein
MNPAPSQEKKNSRDFRPLMTAQFSLAILPVHLLACIGWRKRRLPVKLLEKLVFLFLSTTVCKLVDK